MSTGRAPSKAAQALTDTFRWQAAMGTITGSVLAEARVHGQPHWGCHGAAALSHGELVVRGAELPIDLVPIEALPVAVGLSLQGSPLLVEPATVELIDHVGIWLAESDPPPMIDADLAAAAEIARNATSFERAVDASADLDQAVLVGALFGLRGGIGALGGRLVSELTDPDGRNARRYLARLTDRLLGIRRNDWFDPRNRRGPKQVLPGLWLSNLHGLTTFVRRHPGGLVLSLCDIEGRIDDHRAQITFHLDDTPNQRPNPSFTAVINDVLNEIATARAAGQPVLLHCRHGASRTGLVLRLLLVAEQGLSAADALIEAQCLWPHTSSWNTAWNREVERRA